MVRLTGVILVFGLTVGLVACGGGGGGGIPPSNVPVAAPPATVTSDNADDLSAGASEGAKQAIRDSNALGLRADASQSLPVARLVTKRVLSNSSVGVRQFTHPTETVPGDCGGLATITTNDAGTSGTISYNGFCIVSSPANIVASGTVSFTLTSTSFVGTYTNFTITQGSDSYTFNATISCDGQLNNCTYSSSFVGSNGVSYLTTNVQVSGNNSSGYSVNATISDSTYGSITISASGITICTNGRIGSGTIQISDSTNAVVISVTFPNCDTMVVTYQGVATTYSQITYQPI